MSKPTSNQKRTGGSTADAGAAGASAVRRVSSAELLRDAAELVIEHRGREYRLRVTQSGKLILTA